VNSGQKSLISVAMCQWRTIMNHRFEEEPVSGSTIRKYYHLAQFKFQNKKKF
jgi:hypothetical protein